MSDGNSTSDPGTPGGARPPVTGARGLIGRRPPAPITPGRLPSIRSRDLTLGGVKKEKAAGNHLQTQAASGDSGDTKPQEDVAGSEGGRDLPRATWTRPAQQMPAPQGIDAADPELERIHLKFEPKRLELVREIANLEKQIEQSEREIAMQKSKQPGGLELANTPWPANKPRQEVFQLVIAPACAKKTFTPNIIGRKIKEEPKEDLSIKKEKKDRDRERQRDGAGRGRGRPDIIQSHSIFEQGPAEMMKKKGTWDSSKDMPDLGPSHIINIKKEKRETEEETKKILRMLEKDDFLDDPGLRNDTRNTPVQLPMALSGWIFKEENDDQDCKPWISETKDVKMEVDLPLKVKEEPMDGEDVKDVLPDLKPPVVKKAPGLPPDLTLPELLASLSLAKEEELLFLQLPDTLPGQPPTQDTKPIKTEMQTEDGQTILVKQEKNQEAKLAENTCCLGDLAEGQVGKLLIRKSGKVQLVLGKVTLDITMGTSSSFLQELVSVNLGDGRNGDLTVLGHIKHKLVCSPDFQSLLEDKQR